MLLLIVPPMSLSNSALFLAHSHTHILSFLPLQEEKKERPGGLWVVPAAAYTVLMRCLREGVRLLHCPHRVCVSVRTSVCVNMCTWGRGDLSDNEPPPALIGIIRLPRVKGARSLVSQSCHTKTLIHLQQKCSRNRTSGRLSSN